MKRILFIGLFLFLWALLFFSAQYLCFSEVFAVKPLYLYVLFGVSLVLLLLDVLICLHIGSFKRSLAACAFIYLLFCVHIFMLWVNADDPDWHGALWCSLIDLLGAYSCAFIWIVSRVETGGTWRYSHVSEGDGIKGKLKIGLILALLTVYAALTGIAAIMAVQVPGRYSHPWFLVIGLLAVTAVCRSIVLYLVWELSAYRVGEKGIYVESLFTSRTIEWSEIQSIATYLITSGRLTIEEGGKEYITVFCRRGETDCIHSGSKKSLRTEKKSLSCVPQKSDWRNLQHIGRLSFGKENITAGRFFS